MHLRQDSKRLIAFFAFDAHGGRNGFAADLDMAGVHGVADFAKVGKRQRFIEKPCIKLRRAGAGRKIVI